MASRVTCAATRAMVAALLLLATVAACTERAGDPATGSSPTTSAASASTPVDEVDEQAHPDVLDVELTATGDTWEVAATISSPYDTPDRYADAFRVLAPDGTVLGVRELLHDHAAEQPFTRNLGDVTIPADVTEVTVEGRDLANGWGGTTATVAVPR